jgi:hypothetical protein
MRVQCRRALNERGGQLRSRNRHLINDLFDCHRSRLPVLAITAQTPSAVMNGRGDELVDPAVSNLWL